MTALNKIANERQYQTNNDLAAKLDTYLANLTERCPGWSDSFTYQSDLMPTIGELKEIAKALRTPAVSEKERSMATKTTDAEWVGAVIRGVLYTAPMAGGFQDEKIRRAAARIVEKLATAAPSVSHSNGDGGAA